MASLSVTDSAGMKARGSPVTGEIEVMRQPPLWPPRKVLNIAHGSGEPRRGQAPRPPGPRPGKRGTEAGSRPLAVGLTLRAPRDDRRAVNSAYKPDKPNFWTGRP